MSENVCSICDGERTMRYKNREEHCYRCGGDGEEPTMPKSKNQPVCQHCTVIGGGHRTACPAR